MPHCGLDMKHRHEPLPPEALLPQKAPETKQEFGHVIHLANPIGMLILKENNEVYIPVYRKGAAEPEMRNLREFALEARRKIILEQAKNKKSKSN